jgi:hypothetical protein
MNNWFPEQNQKPPTRPTPDLFTAWQQIADFIKQRVDSEVHDSLLQPIKITTVVDQDEIIAHVPNSVFYQRFLDEVFPLINDAKVLLGFQNINIRLNVE